MEIKFISDLNVSHPQNGLKTLLHDYFVTIEQGEEIYFLKIPAGFQTDFCSVPRMPFIYLLFGGMGEHAGILHDALYSDSIEVAIREISSTTNLHYTRAWADQVLYYALKKIGVSLWRRWSMWCAVRKFGWQYYKRTKEIIRKQITVEP